MEAIRHDDKKPIIESLSHLINKSPYGLFIELLGIHFIDYLVGMTNLYAKQKLSSFIAGSDDLIRFFGIILFSGYHQVPKKNDHWSTREDLSNNIVPKIMPRQKFRNIKNFFHLVDNLNLIEGKAAKIKPFYKHLLRQFLNVGSGVFSKNLSIDEEMVPYYGRHSCKIFMKGKPIRVSDKIWMMCSPDGYPFLMEIYTGTEDDNSKSKKLLGTRVVESLIECVTQPENHSLFFDNIFSSYNSVNSLTDKGFKAIGTIRDNR